MGNTQAKEDEEEVPEDIVPRFIKLVDAQEFKAQTEGTLLGRLPTELVSAVISFRPSRVGIIRTKYTQHSKFTSTSRWKPAHGGYIRSPWTISLPPSQGVAVVGHQAHAVQCFTEKGTATRTIDFRAALSSLALTDCVASPIGLAFQKNGNFVVSLKGADRVLSFSPNGALVQELYHPKPQGIAVDSMDRLYITGGEVPPSVKIINPDGEHLKSLFHDKMQTPCAVSIGPDGTCVVIDSCNQIHTMSRLFIFDSRGNFLRTWDMKPGGWCCTVDCAGNIIVPSPREKSMTLYSPSGETLHTFSGLGFQPLCVAVDVTGYLYITDSEGHQVIVWSPEK